MQVHHLNDVVHFFVLRELHILEDTRNHLGANIIMVAESPSSLRVPSLGTRFTYIMQQRSPAKPQCLIVLTDLLDFTVLFLLQSHHIIHHLKGMIKNILMPTTFNRLNPLKCRQLWENQRQQTTFIQK